MKILEKVRRKKEFRARDCESRNRLYRTAYSWCHNPDLADDLAQQTICKALEKYAQLRDMKALDGWLFRILYRCFVDQKRFNRETPLEESHMSVDYFTPDEAVREANIVLRVRGALSQLSVEQRQVITLVDLEGFTYAEVAKIIEVPVGTVMSRLCRGRRALHQKLIPVKSEQDEIASARVRRLK